MVALFSPKVEQRFVLIQRRTTIKQVWFRQQRTGKSFCPMQFPGNIVRNTTFCPVRIHAGFRNSKTTKPSNREKITARHSGFTGFLHSIPGTNAGRLTETGGASNVVDMTTENILEGDFFTTVSVVELKLCIDLWHVKKRGIQKYMTSRFSYDFSQRTRAGQVYSQLRATSPRCVKAMPAQSPVPRNYIGRGLLHWQRSPGSGIFTCDSSEIQARFKRASR